MSEGGMLLERGTVMILGEYESTQSMPECELSLTSPMAKLIGSVSGATATQLRCPQDMETWKRYLMHF